MDPRTGATRRRPTTRSRCPSALRYPHVPGTEPEVAAVATAVATTLPAWTRDVSAGVERHRRNRRWRDHRCRMPAAAVSTSAVTPAPSCERHPRDERERDREDDGRDLRHDPRGGLSRPGPVERDGMTQPVFDSGVS